MLTVFRRHVRSIGMTIILGVIVLVFVLWGMGSMVRTGRIEYVAKVDGEIVTESEYQKAYQSMVEAYQRMLQTEMTPDLIQRLDLKRRALEELINRKLLLAEATRLGLSITDEELVAEISKLFGGALSKNQYVQALRLRGLSPSEFENSYRGELLARKLLAAITDSVSATDDEIQDWYLFQNEKLSLQLVKVPFTDMVPDTRVTDGEVKEHYEKNKERYREPEKVRLELLTYPNDRFIQFVNPSDEEIKSSYYLQLEDKFTVPDEIRVRHILFRNPGEDAKKKAEVRERAQNVLTRIRDGKDFGDMAKAYSQDEASAKHGGELGFFKKGQTVPAFEEAAFALKPGQVSDPVETPMGLHLIQVEEIKPGRKRTLAEVREEIFAALKKSKASDAAMARATKDREQALKGTPLSDLGKPLGLKVQETKLLSKTELPAEFQTSKDLWAGVFALPPGQIGDLAATPQGMTLFRVKEKKASTILPFEEAKDRAASDLRQEKAREKAKGVAREVLANLKEGKTLREAASKMRVKVEETALFGRTAGELLPDIPSLRGDAFALPPRRTYLDKVYTLKGDAYVAAIKQRVKPDLAEFEKNRETLKTQWIERKRIEATAQYQNTLRTDAARKGNLEENPQFLSGL